MNVCHERSLSEFMWYELYDYLYKIPVDEDRIDDYTYRNMGLHRFHVAENPKIFKFEPPPISQNTRKTVLYSQIREVNKPKSVCGAESSLKFVGGLKIFYALPVASSHFSIKRFGLFF